MTVPEFRAGKARGQKLAVVTAYDFSAALLADAAGVHAILVGDSVGMVVQGHSTSLPVTLGQIVYHTKCVVRGAKRSLVVADLPFMSYQVSPRQAVRSAGKLIQAGAHAVKLEGGERMADAVAACVRADIPVMGHVGLTPQSVNAVGGFKVQKDTAKVVADAKAVAEAGAFAVVVECVPNAVGAAVTAAVPIPTIGIGAGPACDGQVLVWHDILGLYDGLKPKFAKRYAELGEAARTALAAYANEVRAGTFPGPEHGFS
jgi:3-methyl-2-oxobutanoate hydroxymethyltransferase